MAAAADMAGVAGVESGSTPSYQQQQQQRLTVGQSNPHHDQSSQSR
jgi:hypothetical protein